MRTLFPAAGVGVAASDRSRCMDIFDRRRFPLCISTRAAARPPDRAAATTRCSSPPPNNTRPRNPRHPWSRQSCRGQPHAAHAASPSKRGIGCGTRASLTLQIIRYSLLDARRRSPCAQGTPLSEPTSTGWMVACRQGGSAATLHERFTQMLELGKLADAGGLDVISFGEHHRPDFSMSAPEIVLAAISGVTERLRLSSGVTVLSSQDPVRVFEQFATLDNISDGRAEIIAGRGAFVESFPLFGYDLADYDALFDEKLRLLMQIRDNEVVTWTGRFRSALEAAAISPRPVQTPLPIWVGVGGTPASAMRAGALGLPMNLGFFAGPEQFVQRVELYHRAAEAEGHERSSLRVAASGHMYVGKTSQQARADFYPYYSRYLQASGAPFAANGFPRHTYDAWIQASLPVGSPQQVVDAIMRRVELLGIDRFMGQIDVGNLPWSMTRDSLELYMTEVAPVLRRETSRVPTR
ncbi:LLM class flavin-dependent oxidoreductase [Nocardia asteroides]|uniref:LLM class flavin-dependent oxidoreductase n=1 Tax=Nocardia asteroides TaxID=1824 RepID=UPI002FCE16D9